MMRKLQIISSLVLTLILLSSFTVTSGKWEILGKRTVNMRADHDQIMVTAAEGTFRKVKFKVLKAPIYVNNVKIVYGNGSSENHVIKRHFKKGFSSRVLDLKGHNRIIKKIVFNYKTVNVGKGRAHIVAFGKN